jgi:cobalt/nickel transport system permease protein
MAIVNVCGGYFVFRTIKWIVRMEENRGTVFAAAFAAWFGTVLASITCAGQLALSRTVSWHLAFPAMANVHILIGLGEGLATGLIIMAVLRTRPQLVAGTAGNGSIGGWSTLAYGLLISLGLVVFVAPFACPWPDGLESVARTLGFETHATAPLVKTPLADYRLPFIGSPTMATAAAGVIGTIIAFIAAYVLARLLVPTWKPAKEDASSAD